MRIPESLSFRIQLWYGFLLAIVLTMFSVISYKHQQSGAIRRVDNELRKRLTVVQEGLLAVENSTPPQSKTSRPTELRLPASRTALFDTQDPAGYFYIVWNSDGTVRKCSKHLQFAITRPVASEDDDGPIGERFNEPFREMYFFTAQGECALVGGSLAHELRALRDDARLLGAISSGVLLLGLAVGRAITRSALKPIATISATAKKIAQGALTERISIAEKTSELAQLSKTLNESFAQIEDSFTRQYRFAADAAHELRTPVAIIMAQAQQVLNRDREPTVYKKALETCVTASRRLRKLTDTLLELATHDAGVVIPKIGPCDLSDLAREAGEQIRALLVDHGLGISFDLVSTPCVADADQLMQLILNLLSNAIDHTPPLGRITIRTRIEDGHATLSITDTGEGISPDNLPHIFDRFYRADDSRSRKTGGAGLGLAISKSIAESHGAQLSASSILGKGTAFTFRMPVAASANLSPMAPEDHSAPAPDLGEETPSKEASTD
jgi:two-component system OmpR family sensor kinase